MVRSDQNACSEIFLPLLLGGGYFFGQGGYFWGVIVWTALAPFRKPHFGYSPSSVKSVDLHGSCFYKCSDFLKSGFRLRSDFGYVQKVGKTKQFKKKNYRRSAPMFFSSVGSGNSSFGYVMKSEKNCCSNLCNHFPKMNFGFVMQRLLCGGVSVTKNFGVSVIWYIWRP